MLLCSWLVLGWLNCAQAQRWSFEPSVSGQATLTNNANYDTDEPRAADLIMNIAPGISFSREGPRLRVNGSASLNIIGYADSTQTSRLLPQADVLANLMAVDRVFFIEAALRANQETLNPFLPQSNTEATFNKYTYAQARISPYLQGDFANDWSYLVRSDNSYTYTTQSDQPLSDAYFGRHVAELTRLPTPLGGSLQLQSDVTRTNDETQSDQRLDVARATLSYAFNPQLIVGLRGGYESTNYTGDETSGAIYGADLAWSPNPRNRLTGFWESRIFGPSYQVDFTNRQRSVAMNLQASRSFSTYPQLILELPATGNVSGLLNSILVASFPDPVERARQVQNLIARNSLPSSLPGAVNVFTQGANVLTSAGGNFAWTGIRNVLALRIFYLKTELLPNPDIPPTFIEFNNTIQRGATLTLTHRLSPLMTLNALAGRRETRGFDQSAGEVTDQNIIEVQATRQLAPRTQAFIGARYQQQESTTSSIRESNEAAIFVGFAHRL